MPAVPIGLVALCSIVLQECQRKLHSVNSRLENPCHMQHIGSFYDQWACSKHLHVCLISSRDKRQPGLCSDAHCLQSAAIDYISHTPQEQPEILHASSSACCILKRLSDSSSSFSVGCRCKQYGRERRRGTLPRNLGLDLCQQAWASNTSACAGAGMCGTVLSSSCVESIRCCDEIGRLPNNLHNKSSAM